MKKLLAVILIYATVIVFLCGCDNQGKTIAFSGIEWGSDREEVLSSLRKLFKNKSIEEMERTEYEIEYTWDDENEYVGKVYGKYNIKKISTSFVEDSNGKKCLYNILLKTGSDYSKEDCIALSKIIDKELKGNNIERKVLSDDDILYNVTWLERNDDNLSAAIGLQYSLYEEERISISYTNDELLFKSAKGEL